MVKQNRQTFESLCVELDATLIYARVRMAHKDGLAVSTIAKRFNLPPEKVKDYLRGVCCVAKRPRLPTRLCPERSKAWGVPVFRISCSDARLKRSSRFHGSAAF